MSENHIAKKLRQAVKSTATLDDVLLMVDEVLLTSQDTQCASYLRSAVDRAIRGHNTAALRLILKRCQECQPNALRLLISKVTSRQPLLLVLAVQTGNVEAVKLLLQFGANPNGEGVQFHFLQSPLRIAAISPRSEPFCRHKREDSNSSSEAESPMTESDGDISEGSSSDLTSKSLSHEIIRLLLEFGADPLLHFADGSGTIPLHFAPHLAVVCPDAAELLLQSTPADGFDCRFDWPPGTPNSNGMTPLSMALFEANQTLKHGRNVSNVFHSVVVPLLKGGATLHPDPLSSIAQFNDLVYLDTAVSGHLWHHRHMVIKLVLEARWTSVLNAQALRTLSQIANQPGNENAAHALYVRSLFPPRLDHLCRQAVVRRLPRGGSARSDAIDSFGLPRMLSNFLKFSEFDYVPPHHHHHHH